MRGDRSLRLRHSPIASHAAAICAPFPDSIGDSAAGSAWLMARLKLMTPTRPEFAAAYVSKAVMSTSRACSAISINTTDSVTLSRPQWIKHLEATRMHALAPSV